MTARSGATAGRLRGLRRALALAMLGLALSAIGPIALATRPAVARSESAEPITPVPLGRVEDPQRVTLGRRLFHDVRLSGDRGRSCAGCHPLERGGMDGRVGSPTAIEGPRLRNTPTIFNVGLSSYFNWDGVADNLEAHAEIVLASPSLMNIAWPDLLGRLEADAEYVAGFRAAYRDGLTRDTVLDALATFERSLDTPNSRFDRYLRGDRAALTAAERRGYALFKAYGCVTCHQGVNIGGNMFQKFGVFPDHDVPGPDLGRYLVTGVARDRGVFRVPSLRNVAVTAPYFHDGRAASLEVAVRTMARVQLGRTLQEEDIARIIDFLRTLTGEYEGQPIGPGARE